MAILPESFNVEDLPEDENNFDPIPEGTYAVEIKATELKATKDGSGQFIKMKLSVIGPSYTGRILFANLNIRNKSADAERIGRQQLGAVMKAIGLTNIQDTDQLIGGVMSVKVSIRAAQGEYAAQNDIKSYSPNSTTMSNKPLPQSSAPAETKAAPPPWAKR